jgi:hypothetical protein
VHGPRIIERVVDVGDRRGKLKPADFHAEPFRGLDKGVADLRRTRDWVFVLQRG